MTGVWFALVGVMAALSWWHALSQTPSARVTRDTRAEGSSSEPVCIGLGQMSSVGGESRSEPVTPVGLGAAGPTLDAFPRMGVPGVPGPAARHEADVDARVVMTSECGGSRLGAAS